MSQSLAEYQRICQHAVRAAGATIQAWVGRTSVKHKGPADLVTEADMAAQHMVRDIVLGAFPHHTLLGEEDGPVAAPRGAAEFRWITDPLDGTTNFVHRVPHYAVSLALEQNGRLLVGAIYDPSRDECFTAAAGQGAFLNGQPIHVSEVAQLSEALAGSGFPASVRPDSPDLLVFNRAIYQCQGVRRTGSAALNMCYVASGRYDLLWGFSTKVWDIAAGVLLIREAGGIVLSPEGTEFELDRARFIAAATPPLMTELQAMVRAGLAQ